ncbi:hypothetical protein ASF79_10700 [Agreia sp. Leaf335]|uniref:hypothetical protein n=1 Tax=Agreia sp. Leaf335 TaxID=1736340 RepID=UPI0007163F30|nr:hypothetical protein [Agreia sp. Leaf335]KQR20063.1 hypothetical protein ASF79_10700 [Agreia sp. Leaf335]
MSDPRSRARPYLIVALVVVAVLAVLYAARVGLLLIGASEWDSPPVSAVPLPDGTEVTQVSTECASGGCWTLITVRPPDGTTPEDLKNELGTTPQSRLPGSFWDPRTVSLTSKTKGPFLVIKADYFSPEYVH